MMKHKNIILFTALSLVAGFVFSPCRGTNLTSQTLHLKSFLQTSHKQGFMIGHHDDTVYGIGWNGDEDRSDIKSVCGDYPAILSFDLGRIELGHKQNLDNVAFDRIRSEAVKQYLRGGIVTFSWHLNNPSTGKDAWDVSDTAVVKKILPGGVLHQEFLKRLDYVAAFINSIKTPKGVKVPVLFRPWHENSGGWFWWGIKCCTPKEYKALWRMTVKHLADKGVNNALYVYSPGADKDAFLRTYPGDGYVDIAAFDQYQDGISHEQYVKSMHTMLQFLTTFGKEHHKPIAVSETGYVTLPDSLWWTQTLLPILKDYPVTWVLFWRNARLDHFFAPYPGQKSAADFVRFYEDKGTLFCKDIKISY